MLPDQHSLQMYILIIVFDDFAVTEQLVKNTDISSLFKGCMFQGQGIKLTKQPTDLFISLSEADSTEQSGKALQQFFLSFPFHNAN